MHKAPLPGQPALRRPRPRWCGVLATAMTLGLAHVGSAQPASAGVVDNPDLAAIDRYVLEQMKDCRIPGFSLGVVKDGEVLYAKGYGHADASGRPVSPQTPFVLASVSKTFTALALMQLQQAGKVDLDMPVSRYLPDLETTSHTFDKMTVRQLLNHTAGFGPQLEYRAATPTDLADDPRDLVRRIGSFPLASQPGAEFRYGSAAYVVLGEVVSGASGLTFQEYVERNIFRPLEMNHSFVSRDKASQGGLAAGYRTMFGFPRVSKLTYGLAYLAAYGIMSCVEDMTHYLIAMMNGGVYGNVRILPAEAVAEMLRPSSSVSRYEDYGLGWFVTSGSFYHGGELSDFQAKVKVLPPDGVGIVFLDNSSSSTAETLFGVGYRERIETGIINILYGVSPTDQPTRGPFSLSSYPMSVTYGLMAALPVVAAALLLMSLFRWLRVSRRLAGPRSGLPRAAASVALFHVLLPLFVCLAVPRLGVSWRYVLHYVPDVGWLALVCSVALVVVGAAKVVLIVRSWSSRRERPLGGDGG